MNNMQISMIAFVIALVTGVSVFAVYEDSMDSNIVTSNEERDKETSNKITSVVSGSYIQTTTSELAAKSRFIIKGEITAKEIITFGRDKNWDKVAPDSPDSILPSPGLATIYTIMPTKHIRGEPLPMMKDPTTGEMTEKPMEVYASGGKTDTYEVRSDYEEYDVGDVVIALIKGDLSKYDHYGFKSGPFGIFKIQDNGMAIGYDMTLPEHELIAMLEK